MTTETLTLPSELIKAMTETAENKNVSITALLSSIFNPETADLDPKEKFLKELEEKILGNLTGDQLSCTFMTCKDAPSYGWSRDEYMYMPLVASRLRSKGFNVSSSVNHGVTDWIIAR